MMTARKTLNNVLPGWATGQGIFTVLQTKQIPWADENIATALDLEYFGNVSGGKFISPLLEKLLTGDELTGEQTDTIANVLVALYGDNWQKQWATITIDYDPIENYSMTEQMSDDKTVTEYGRNVKRTDDLTHAKTGTDKVSPNLTNESANKVHGFNSTEGVPTGEQTQTATGDTTTTYNTQDKDSGTTTNAESGQDSHTRNYKLTRTGNIGVTTSQEMITAERTLRMWNYFTEVVFPDLDRVLTLRIY